MSSGGPPPPPSPPPDGWPPPAVPGGQSPPPGQDPVPPPPDPRAPAPAGSDTGVPPPSQDGPAPIVPHGDQQLAPRVLALWRVGGAIPFAFLLLPAIGVGIGVGGLAWLAPLGVVAVAALVAGPLPGLRYARWRWRMTDQALELEHGVVFRQVRALPYFRIQHIDVEHGPLDRWLGLARLEVHTASVTATLPGLPATEAPGIRVALLALAGSAVASEPSDDAV